MTQADRTARLSRAVVGAMTAVALGAMVVRGGALFALVATAMVGLLMLTLLVHIFMSSPSREPLWERRILWWTVMAFFAHLLVSLALTNFGGPFRTYLAAPDALTYHDTASHLVNHWTYGHPTPDLPAGKEGFYYLLAALYWVFGAHTSAGLAFNATVAAALVPVVTDTARRLFGPAAGRYVPPLVVLLPGLFLWTSQLIKEAPILFLIALAANCAVRLSDRISVGPLAGLVIALPILFSFRAWVALTIAVGLVAGIAAGKGQILSGISTGLAAASLIAVLLAVGLGLSGFNAAVDSDLEQANTVRRDLATANSGYAADADVSTPARAVSFLPQGLPIFLFGPFPWHIRGARQLPVVPDMLVWWLLLPSLWAGLRVARQLAGRRILVLVLPAVSTSILLALAIGNFGTVVRERTQIVVLVVPIIALGLSRRAQTGSGSRGRLLSV